MPAVEVRRRPAPPSLTTLPEELVKYLTERGKRWSYQPKDRDFLSLLYSRGIRPLRVADIEDKEVRKVVEDVYAPNDAGYVQRFDAVLCVQSEEAVAADRANKALMLSSEDQARNEIGELEEKLQRLFGSTGYHSGAPILEGNIPTLSQQVVNRAPGVTIGG